jgi:hypothetical protein
VAQNSLPAFPLSQFPQLLTELVRHEIARVDRVLNPVLHCSICGTPDSDACRIATIGGEPFCFHCAMECCG